MKVGNFFSCHAKSALLVVTDYHDGVLKGLLMHPRLEKAQRIYSLSHLLLYLDTFLDLDMCPGSHSPLVYPDPEYTNAIAKFQIQILFREHYTWQGRLILIDKNQEAVFRSAIELIQLMDDILAT